MTPEPQGPVSLSLCLLMFSLFSSYGFHFRLKAEFHSYVMLFTLESTGRKILPQTSIFQTLTSTYICNECPSDLCIYCHISTYSDHILLTICYFIWYTTDVPCLRLHRRNCQLISRKSVYISMYFVHRIKTSKQ